VNVAYKRVLINIPEELLEEVDRVARLEHCMRSEFVREALRYRIARSNFESSLARLRAQADNDYPEADVDRDVAGALAEARAARKSGIAA